MCLFKKRGLFALRHAVEKATLSGMKQVVIGLSTLSMAISQADQLMTPTSVTTNGVSEFFSATNLINNSGLSAAADATNYTSITHAAASATTAWTTNNPNGAGDYFLTTNPGTLPVFTFTLPEATNLNQMVAWGYHFGASNGNEARKFLVEFSEDGGTTYPNSVTVESPAGEFMIANPKTFDFGGAYHANTVRVSMTDNHFGTGAGGDRVGLGEIKFYSVSDPSLQLGSSLVFNSNGSDQTFQITINNAGASNPLTITSITPGGTNGNLFTLTESLPVTIPAGESYDFEVSFAPGTLNNSSIDANFQIESNDPDLPSQTVPATGAIRDPWIQVDEPSFLGDFARGQTPGSAILKITNNGSSETLTLDSANFGFNSIGVFELSPNAIPASIAPGQSLDLPVTVHSETTSQLPFLGGLYGDLLTVATNDFFAPNATINLEANLAKLSIPGSLVGWWPLDEGPADASGFSWPSNENGIINYSNPGANANTGNSATMDGTMFIDVPVTEYLNPESFTVTLWAFPDTGTGYQSPITSRFDNAAIDGTTFGYVLYNDINSRWAFWSGDANPSTGFWNAIIEQPNTVALSAWSHLAITYDAETETKTLYVNGIAVGTQNSPVARNLVKNLHIGGGGDDGLSFRFQGRLDDLAIFCEALTEEQISVIMSEGVAGYIGAISPLAITGLTANGGQISVTGVSGLRTGVSYHLEAGTTLEDFLPVPDSTFTKDTLVLPTLPALVEKLFIRIVEGPGPVR